MESISDSSRRRREKKIPYYRLGKKYLFIKEDLDEYIRKQKG
ncbi:MAG: helix-turn-helix domain-containing protein [Candidatus Aminicenantes bacterium]|nr:MAG: helix-turn-helix domain-containing protein [Candidatus Aminicenantes bacterium]